MKTNSNQISSILLFRKVCLNYSRRRHEKYYNIWVRNALKPMALVRRNKELTHFQTRQEFLRKFLTLWSHQKIKKQKNESQ